MIYITGYSSPIGNITIASDGKALVGLWIEEQKYFMSKYKFFQQKADLEIFTETKMWLDEYFKGNNPPVTMYLKPEGTKFQEKVWRVLENIPYGKTVTYGDISKKLNVNSGQAVGGAVGGNPISIIIPCHRVVGKDKSLTGYAGGIDKKSALLKLENADI